MSPKSDLSCRGRLLLRPLNAAEAGSQLPPPRHSQRPGPCPAGRKSVGRLPPVAAAALRGLELSGKIMSTSGRNCRQTEICCMLTYNCPVLSHQFSEVVSSGIINSSGPSGQPPPPPPPSLKGRLAPEGWRAGGPAGRPPPLPGRELRSTLRSAFGKTLVRT